MQTDYKTVFQLAQDKGMRFLKCKHCGNIELNCLKDNLCTSCFTYAETPTTQWANGVDTNLLILTLIQKWLRDKHKIVVNVFPYDAEDFIKAVYGVNIINTEWGTYKECHVEKMLRTYPDSYEFALLEGVREALKLI